MRDLVLWIIWISIAIIVILGVYNIGFIRGENQAGRDCWETLEKKKAWRRY